MPAPDIEKMIRDSMENNRKPLYPLSEPVKNPYILALLLCANPYIFVLLL